MLVVHQNHQQKGRFSSHSTPSFVRRRPAPRNRKGTCKPRLLPSFARHKELFSRFVQFYIVSRGGNVPLSSQSKLFIYRATQIRLRLFIATPSRATDTPLNGNERASESGGESEALFNTHSYQSNVHTHTNTLINNQCACRQTINKNRKWKQNNTKTLQLHSSVLFTIYLFTISRVLNASVLK